MEKKSKISLIYLAIITVQILNLLYWANVKTNYHIDELYSMGYASIYTGAEDTAQYITTSGDWKYNEWISNVEFKKYLTISDKEEIFNMPFVKMVEKFVREDSYSGILNLAESFWGYDVVTKWPGIVLNIFIFVAVELVLIALATRLKMSQWSVCLLVSMFGFCGYFIGLVEYIRFYMLVMLLLLIMILLHHKIWTSEKLWRIIVCEIGGFAMAYLGMKNSQLMLVYAGAMMGFFCVALLITKQWKKLGTYVFMISMAVLYLAYRSNWLDILFHIEKYINENSQVGVLTANIVKTSPRQVIDYLIWVVYLLTYSYFGHHLTAILWTVLCAGFLVILLRNYKVDKQNFLWFDREDGFMLVLLGTLISYTLFAGAAGISLSRYYSFGVITFLIIMWYVIHRIMQMMPSKWVISCYGLLTVLTVMSSLAPLITRDVEYIYEQDEKLISSLQTYQGTDTVLVPIVETNGEVSRHEVYDCVNLMNDETRIFPIDSSSYVYQVEELPDRFLLWTHVGDDDIIRLINKLEMDGYYLKELPIDHVSRVYVCEKRKEVTENDKHISRSTSL